MSKHFTYPEHIKKHTLKENTYNPECEFCNPSGKFQYIPIYDKNYNLVDKKLKKIL